MQKSDFQSDLSRVMRKIFVYAKTKAQISLAVSAKLVSAFVFATWIVIIIIIIIIIIIMTLFKEEAQMDKSNLP